MPYTLRRRFSNRAYHWALMAMLLVVLGPLAGQASEALLGSHSHPHAAHKDLPRTISASSVAPTGTPYIHPHAANRGSTSSSDHAAQGLHDACGYCSLFKLVPVLYALLPGVAPVRDRTSAPTPRRQLVGHGDPAVFPNAQTRAPPRV
ncbi:DUF2946 domain-containing protein [Halomonas sp. V046]|uniref:DUF2946 domain-containing protein n=1 Tax=Halomonas sp. V046 TaxID=3459611 RepID=UPI0040451979